MEFVADLLYELPKTFSLVFDVAHFIVCLQGERADMGDSFEATTKQHPLVGYSICHRRFGFVFEVLVVSH